MSFKNKFIEQGYLGPVPVLNATEIDYYYQHVVAAEQELDLAHSDYRYKSNVLFPWVDQLSKHPTIVNVVRELIGDNFTCPDTIFWIKRPGENRDVSWHQDATYWNFTNPEKCCVVWYAFNDVTTSHGPLQYIPGTHTQQIKHNDIKNNTNLLMRGQTVDYFVDQSVEVTVPAGNIVVHHPYIIHGSSFNTTNESRLAVSFIYASTDCKPRIEHSRESAVLISGNDQYNFMQHDPAPRDPWENNLSVWRDAYDRQHDNYFRLTQRPAGQ